MTDRDRLIELIENMPWRITQGYGCCKINAAELADYFTANGVIVPQRETDEHKIQIGDVLYEYSYTYGKVHEWKVLDIWLENYISGNKTIVKCSNGTWKKEFFVADVLQFHKTKEEAEAELRKRSEDNA